MTTLTPVQEDILFHLTRGGLFKHEKAASIVVELADLAAKHAKLCENWASWAQSKDEYYGMRGIEGRIDQLLEGATGPVHVRWDRGQSMRTVEVQLGSATVGGRHVASVYHLPVDDVAYAALAGEKIWETTAVAEQAPWREFGEAKDRLRTIFSRMLPMLVERGPNSAARGLGDGHSYFLVQWRGQPKLACAPDHVDDSHPICAQEMFFTDDIPDGGLGTSEFNEIADQLDLWLSSPTFGAVTAQEREAIDADVEETQEVAARMGYERAVSNLIEALRKAGPDAVIHNFMDGKSLWLADVEGGGVEIHTGVIDDDVASDVVPVPSKLAKEEREQMFLFDDAYEAWHKQREPIDVLSEIEKQAIVDAHEQRTHSSLRP
jgi:hypothetical protein